MKSEDKKQMQRKIQGKYRKIKQRNREDKTTSKKEAIFVALILFIILILDALVKSF